MPTNRQPAAPCPRCTSTRTLGPAYPSDWTDCVTCGHSWNPSTADIPIHTPTVFRRWRDDPQDIVALFPTIPGTNDPDTCMAYARVGQHSSADYRSVIRGTIPATPTEYAELRKELERIGYNVVPFHRAFPSHHDERRKAVRRSVSAKW